MSESAQPSLPAREPVLSISAITSVVAVLLAFAVAHGWITDTQASEATQAVAPVVAFLIPLIAGIVARAKVTPVAAVPSVKQGQPAEPAVGLSTPGGAGSANVLPSEPVPSTAQITLGPDVPLARVAAAVDALNAANAIHPVG